MFRIHPKRLVMVALLLIFLAGSARAWLPGDPTSPLLQGDADELTLDGVPPVVVRCVPEAGSSDVDPAVKELRVTFSKPMTDRSWSWSTASKSSFPTVTGDIHYLADGRTCVLPVKLEPGKTYASWINSSKFRNFKDKEGRPAIPYLLVFRTKS